MHLKNIEEHSDYFISENWYKSKKQGVSAFLRVKDEEEFIAPCLLSIKDFFDEIVLALNNCSDRTPEIVRSLGLPHLKIFEYPFNLHHNGPGHDSISENSIHDNSYYYNWLLSKTTYSHVCKWDGDMVALPALDSKLKQQVLTTNITVVTGINISGESMSHLSLGAPFSTEPRFFKIDQHTFYRQGKLVEQLTHAYKHNKSEFETPIFLHFKNVKSIDSATKIWPENWRKIPHFQNLLERSPLCQKRCRLN